MWKNVSFCSPGKFMLATWQLCAGTLFCLVRVGIGDEAPLAISWFLHCNKIFMKASRHEFMWLTPPPPLLWGHFFPRCFLSNPNERFLCLTDDSFRLHSMNVQWKNKILTFWLGENFRMVQTYIAVSIYRLSPGRKEQVRSIYRDTPSSGTTSSPSAFSRRSSRSSTSLLW